MPLGLVQVMSVADLEHLRRCSQEQKRAVAFVDNFRLNAQAKTSYRQVCARAPAFGSSVLPRPRHGSWGRPTLVRWS